jgi:hypothetical protein
MKAQLLASVYGNVFLTDLIMIESHDLDHRTLLFRPETL